MREETDTIGVVFGSRATVYRLGRAEGYSGLMGLGSRLQSTVSQKELPGMRVTGPRGGFAILMEPVAAQWKVTELIKGLTMGLWRELESED